MKRSFLFTALFLMAIMGHSRLVSQTATLVPVVADDNAIMFKVSDNGLWAVGYYGSEGNDVGGTLWNLTTYEATHLSDANGVAAAYDVSNDGSIVVGSYQNKPAYWQNGSWHVLPLPGIATIGEVRAVTPDGSKMGGRAFNSSLTVSYACVWENDQLVELNLPDVDRFGDNANFNEIVAFSADGNTILGCLNYNVLPNRTAFVIKDGEYIMFGAQYYDPATGGDEYNFYDVLSMSPNGRYVTGDIYWIEEVWTNEYYCPFRYDVVTDEVELFLDDVEMASFASDNDGVLYGANPLNFPMRNPYFVKNGQWVSFEQEIINTYGIDIHEQTGYDGLGNIFSVSADGKTIVGTNGVTKYNWVFKIGSITGIESPKSSDNPMKAVIKGQRLALGGKVKSYAVFDMQGKRVMGGQVVGAPLYDISQLPVGTYIVHMTDASNNTASSKVAISR